MADGIRAGVGTLILVTAIVVLALARFAWRLWSFESLERSLAQDRTQQP